MATTLSDFFVPEIASNYWLLEMIQKNALINSGIARLHPELNEAAKSAGKLLTMPQFNQLSVSDEPNLGDDSVTEITPFDLDGTEFLARKNFRTASWQAPKIIEPAATGQKDSLTAALDENVDWWANKDQKLLLSMLDGLFGDGSGVLSANENSIFSETGASPTADKLIGADAVIETKFVLGDRQDAFTAIAMHSVPFMRLSKLDVITYVPTSVQNPTLMPTYLGMRVIVDDNLPARAGTTSGMVYTSYLFGQGSVGYAQVPTDAEFPAVELIKQPTQGKGAGTKQLLTRNYNIISPLGCSFSGTPGGMSPSNTEYELKTNWTLAWDQKRVNIASLVTNG